jgi:diguanylate cyclase (GGDEF)-like protein/PAS domain S-box-containing protein
MTLPDDIHARRLAREIGAREQAEALLEQKYMELFQQAQERQCALDALSESEERYRLIVERSPDAILIEVNGQIVFANPAARLIFRETPDRPLLGRSLALLFRRAEAETSALMEITTPAFEAEEIALRLDGSAFEVSVHRVSSMCRGRPAMQLLVRDISTRKKLEYQLAYQATHDALTGTNNRRALLDHLSDAIAYAYRNQLAVWVAFIDLNRFKLINDRFGHRIGDLVLVSISQRLRQVLRVNDVLGRFGGDEFIVVLRGGTDAAMSSDILDRIMQAVAEPLTVEGHQLRINCSVGVAVFPQDGTTPQLLLERADAAMYRAKESGLHRCQFFNEEIHQHLQTRARIESDLAGAMERGEFFLEYQPQIDLNTGNVVGAEALLRWRHPDLGLMTPERFIDPAEESQLITEIGTWVLDQACKQCAAWHQSGMGRLRIAVNLSARQLNGLPLIRLVDTALTRSGLPADCLELELTESLMMSNIDITKETLQKLHTMGVQVAIDDFGTGYSSFLHLGRLPLACLKIDRQFIHDLSNLDMHDTSIITRTLIQLAQNLGLRVIAEGVENQEQLRLLQQQGCDEIQGFLYSGALVPDEFERQLRLHQPERWRRPS